MERTAARGSPREQILEEWVHTYDIQDGSNG